MLFLDLANEAQFKRNDFPQTEFSISALYSDVEFDLRGITGGPGFNLRPDLSSRRDNKNSAEQQAW
jgi:hypothetical protein